MSRLRMVLLFGIAAVLLCGMASAGEFYVDAEAGSNSNTGRSPGDAWLNIGYALSRVRGSSSDPVTIHIAAGTYSPSTNGEPYPISMESYVSLVGAGADSTILDAEGDAYHVILAGSVSEVRIEYLTIRGGNADGNQLAAVGGGILCRYGDDLTIEGCTITENNAVMGGGILLLESSASLLNCEIIGNTVDGETDQDGFCAGAGIKWANCSLTIDGCVIAENEAFGRRDGGSAGAGISGTDTPYGRKCFTDQMGHGAQDGYYTVISNSIISDNSCAGDLSTSGMGGGIFLADSSPLIMNCLFVRNYSSRYGGAFLIGMTETECSPEIVNCTIAGNSTGYDMGGAVCCLSATPTFRDCILWGDGDTIYPTGWEIPFSYSCIQGGYPGEGNISDDPLFVSGPIGDYYLSCEAAGQGENSPCIDAGNDTAEALGLDELTTRTDCGPDTGIVDMGYHYPIYLGGPTIECSLNASRFRPGGYLVGSLKVANDGLDIEVDVYVAFVLPDGAIFYATPHGGLIGEIQPWMQYMLLPEGYSYGPAPMFEAIVPGGIPHGDYLFAGALSTPGVFEVIGELSLFPFTLRAETLSASM